MQRNQKLFVYLCLMASAWHVGLQWTNLLFPFLEWEVKPPMTMFNIGVIHALGNLWNMIGAFTIGLLIDNCGMKRCMIVSTISTGIYYLLISYANSFWTFAMTQMFRLGFHFDHLTEIFVSTLSSDEERTGALLKLSIPAGVSLMVGPFLAGKVSILYDIHSSQMLNSLLQVAALLPAIVYLIPDTSRCSSIQLSKLKFHQYLEMTHNDKLVKCICLRSLLAAALICHEMVTWQYIVREHSDSPNDATRLFYIIGAALLFTNFYGIGKLKQLYDAKTMVQMATGCLVLCYVLLALISNYKLIVLLVVLQTVANAVATAEVVGQIMGAVEKSHLGKASGLAKTVQWSLHCTIPLVSGFIIQHWNYQILCWMAALFSTLALVEISQFGDFLNTRTVELPWLLTS